MALLESTEGRGDTSVANLILSFVLHSSAAANYITYVLSPQSFTLTDCANEAEIHNPFLFLICIFNFQVNDIVDYCQYNG